LTGGRLEVVQAGPLTTVQDLGRPGWAHLGVTTSGAADRAAFKLANRLVGNQEGAAGLEVTMGGLELRALADLTIAITGAPCPITIAGTPSPARTVLGVASGQTIRLDPAPAGVRAYLAVRGGIDVPAVLGSRSTDTLSGLGPAALAAGDLLAIGSEVAGWPVLTLAPGADPTSEDARLYALPGPRDDALDPAAWDRFRRTRWRVSDRSDRVGVRLEGPPLSLAPPVEAIGRPSEGVVRGAIQVPPNGLPVVFLADHPVTGGYPVVAVLTEIDADRAGQLRPGQGLIIALLADIRLLLGART